MVKNKRRPESLHDNSIDIGKNEYSINEVSNKLNARILNKLAKR